MYGYIYITENLINNKKYIGQHRATKFSKKYKGSGKLLQKAFTKYGKENFKCTILKECFSDDELNSEEIRFIQEYNAVESDEFYNIARGGQGHTCDPWNKGKVGCYKANENQLKALEYGRHLPSSQKQKEVLARNRRNFVASDETREKCRTAGMKGRKPLGYKWMTNGTEVRRIPPEKIQEYLLNGYIFGSKTNQYFQQ